eukprot:Sdes_comp18814_c0_seq1m9227
MFLLGKRLAPTFCGKLNFSKYFSKPIHSCEKIKVMHEISSWKPGKILPATISEILTEGDAICEKNQTVKISGWIKHYRKQKHVSFFNVNDGSCLAGIQIVCETNPKSTHAVH